MKYSETETGQRGTKIRTDFGRDRSDEMPTNMKQARHGKLMGDVSNIDPMIKGGKVPKL